MIDLGLIFAALVALGVAVVCIVRVRRAASRSIERRLFRD